MQFHGSHMIRSDHDSLPMPVIRGRDNPSVFIGINLHAFPAVSACLYVVDVLFFQFYVWWNEDWTSRKKITLTGPSSEVTDVPVLIRLHTGNFDFFSASDNGGDVRLAGANGQR